MSVIIKIVLILSIAVVATTIFFYLEEGRWPSSRMLRKAYRHVTGRCLWCGKKRERHPNCLHCITSDYNNWRVCHHCAKQRSFSRLYGAGPTTLSRIENAL